MIEVLRKAETGRTFGRFLIFGLINTAFGYCVYAVLILVGMAPQPALVVAFVVGVMWNYFTSARFVFRIRGVKRLPVYAGCYILIYLGNAACLQAALGLGANPLVAQGILTPFFAVISFVVISFALTGRIGGTGD